MEVDIIIGLQFGDEAKGKVANSFVKNREYTYVCKASGGPNCGHTVIVNGQTVKLHQVSVGALYGITSVIGAGCVVDPVSLEKEISGLEELGFKVRPYIKIAYNAHVIRSEHILEDIKYDKVGSTNRGIMPAFRDKYAREGVRAKNIECLAPYICDTYNLLGKDSKILVEGAQGFYLCPDNSPFYPYVTSSPPTSTYALHSLGLPPKSIRNIIGCAKVYETYVGNRDFGVLEYKEDLDNIANVGKEFGATTGRKRKVDFLNIDMLLRAIEVNGVDILIISKLDVLREVNIWKCKDRDCIDEYGFKKYVESVFQPYVNIIIWSDSPADIQLR